MYPEAALSATHLQTPHGPITAHKLPHWFVLFLTRLAVVLVAAG